MTKAELTVIMASVKSYVEGRLSQVEIWSGPAGERGERGEPGKDGRDGIDGKDGIGAVGPVGAQGANGDPGEKGERGESIVGPKGDTGERGERGLQGEPGVRGEAGLSIMGERGENGKDGRDGVDGKDGKQGEKGERGHDGVAGSTGSAGERGVDGKDGKDAVLPDLEPLIQRAFDAGFSRWAVDMERRAQDLFQRAIERMPVPKDGKDGFELEDLSVADDGHGNVTLTFIRGALTRSFVLRLPCFEYCGTFAEGQRYLSGHGVTYGGSFWIAQKDDAQGKPGDRDTDWILAVKKGRDGRDGVMREAKPEATVKL